MAPYLLLSLLLVSPVVGRLMQSSWNEDEIDDSPLTKELLEEGLLHRPETGHPRVTCLSRKMNQPPVLEECVAVPRHSSVSVGCYSVWDDEGGHLQQGCLKQQDISLIVQCKKRLCKADPNAVRMQDMNFCCCFGNKCNAQYST